jgi:opacity protein-like surface antigen
MNPAKEEPMKKLFLASAVSLAAFTLPASAADMIATDGLKARPNTVTVASVTAGKAGYLVVHESSDGTTAGTVIGSKAINAGENENVSIPLEKKMKPGDKLIVMMHSEDDNDTEFDEADKPVTSGRGPVQQIVTVE